MYTVRSTKVEVIVNTIDKEAYKTKLFDLGFSYYSQPYNSEFTMFTVYIQVDPFTKEMRPA